MGLCADGPTGSRPHSPTFQEGSIHVPKRLPVACFCFSPDSLASVIQCIAGVVADGAQWPMRHARTKKPEPRHAPRRSDSRNWCEANGLKAERTKHLNRAVLTEPKSPLARGLLGEVEFKGRYGPARQHSRQDSGGRVTLANVGRITAPRACWPCRSPRCARFGRGRSQEWTICAGRVEAILVRTKPHRNTSSLASGANRTD